MQLCMLQVCVLGIGVLHQQPAVVAQCCSFSFQQVKSLTAHTCWHVHRGNLQVHAALTHTYAFACAAAAAAAVVLLLLLLCFCFAVMCLLFLLLLLLLNAQCFRRPCNMLHSSPADYNADETMTSLTYAARVKLITNSANKNQDSAEISRLKAIIKKLQAGEKVEVDTSISDAPEAASDAAGAGYDASADDVGPAAAADDGVAGG